MSDFVVSCDLRTLAGAAMFSLHDEAGGFEVLAPIGMAEESWDRDWETSRHMDGAAASAETLTIDRVVLRLVVSGSSWIQTEQRRLAARAAWIDVPSFLLDVGLEGVTYTWRAHRPDVSEMDVDVADLMGVQRSFLLTFPVQPSPTITGV